jgi:hypothetical protein
MVAQKQSAFQTTSKMQFGSSSVHIWMRVVCLQINLYRILQLKLSSASVQSGLTGIHTDRETEREREEDRLG